MCQMQQGSESQEDLHEICLHIAEQCPSERGNVPNGPAAERAELSASHERKPDQGGDYQKIGNQHCIGQSQNTTDKTEF